MKKLLMFAMVAVVAFSAQADLLLQETFSHPADTPLFGTTPETGGTWFTNGTGTGAKSNLFAGSLSAPAGFVASTGNRVVVGKDSAIIGKEMHSRFTAQTGAGAVTYMSFLMNMETLNAGKGGSCIGLSENSGAEYAQLFITNTTPNTYATFGLGGRSTAPGIWSSGQFATGVTHLIVVSYEVVAGITNDIMKMWIDPTSFGGAAPGHDLQITGVAGGDAGAAGLNTVEIKNGSIMPRMGIDELRIGTTWADVTTQAAPPVSCKLVFSNTDPAQFIQKPFVTTDLPFGVLNQGAAASNVTVSVTSTYSWLTVNTGTSSVPQIGASELVTNIFNVTFATNAPTGVYPDAFTMTMQGTGPDGVTSNSSAQVSLQIVNTALASMSKTAFAADTNGIDTAMLTVSNTSAAAFSFVLSDALSAAWISYPAGTLTLPANTTTNITITVNGGLTAGLGNYTNTFSVQYLDNPSTPNPVNFPLSFYVGPDPTAFLVVNLSGNYQTSTSQQLGYVMPASNTVGEALIYDNDFSIAIVTNGTPAPGASGFYTGQTVYGSFRQTMTGGTAGSPPVPLTIKRIDQGDQFTLNSSIANTVGESNGLATTVDLMYVFKKADFINDRNIGSVVFDAASVFSVTSGSWNANSRVLRAVVQNGSTWYISQNKATNTIGTHTIMTNASVAQWAVWDPLTSIDISAVPDFSSTVVGSTFTDIQAVGIYGHLVSTNTIIQTGIKSIQIGGVAASSGFHTLTASAIGNGTVSPANTSVSSGGSANFTVTASNYYRIASLTANGSPVSGPFDNNSTATNFLWSNVQANGALVATFTAQTANDPAGTPYSWLASYGLTNYNTDAVADQDLDGLQAWQEYIAGTVPTNTASSFRIVESPRNVLSWNAASGRVYSVYWATNLLSGFQSLEPGLLSPQNSYTNVNPDSRVNHYQIKVRMQE